MTSDAGAGEYELTGSDAEQWFMHTRGGGHILDAHLGAIQQHFGPDVNYRVRAPIDPIGERPTFLIIEIDPPANLFDPWQALSAVELNLLEQRDFLTARSRRKDPFARIVLTLRYGAEGWESARAEIEQME